MEAKLAEQIPSDGEEWQYEPKWDGFRFLAFKSGARVDIRGKSGKPLGRYFPELMDLLSSLNADRFVVDGEIVIEVAGHYSFDALQMRLHPAESRIRKLASQTPAKLILFDMLADTNGRDVRDEPLSVRRTALEKFVKPAKTKDIELSAITLNVREARKWLTTRDAERTDGIVAKRRGQAIAQCRLRGWGLSLSRKQKAGRIAASRSLQRHGQLDHVGFTSTIRNEDRADLTKRLEKLRESPGFTGNAPGGPSRWSNECSVSWEPLRPELVVEVRFDQVTAKRFRHGTRLLRWRSDKAPPQGTFEQID
jgi:ATP-dependent DNA ligase